MIVKKPDDVLRHAVHVLASVCVAVERETAPYAKVVKESGARLD
jgi:hypothetical protein